MRKILGIIAVCLLGVIASYLALDRYEKEASHQRALDFKKKYVK